MPPRTIDNLGVDVSTRYAQDVSTLDESILKDARGITLQTQIDVTLPAFASEFEMLFELSKKNLPWAEFNPPLRYNEQKKRVFTHQLIPSLGTQEKRERETQKIIAKADTYVAKREGGKDREGQKNPQKKFMELQEEELVKKEKKILIKLLDCIIYLDKDVAAINSKRSQYQKG